MDVDCSRHLENGVQKRRTEKMEVDVESSIAIDEAIVAAPTFWTLNDQLADYYSGIVEG